MKRREALLNLHAVLDQMKTVANEAAREDADMEACFERFDELKNGIPAAWDQLFYATEA